MAGQCETCDIVAQLHEAEAALAEAQAEVARLKDKLAFYEAFHQRKRRRSK